MNPKVSVIMGIYNCSKTLPMAIESVLNQTYTKWELIMCDDGSKDDTYVIAKAYADKYPNKIILIRNEKNMRLAATLNRCLNIARGEYIARCDADDECLNNRFQVQVDYLDNNQGIACVGSSMIIFDDHGDRGIRVVHNVENEKNSFYSFAHPTIMMRKNVYDILGGYTVADYITRCEDVDLWFKFNYNGFIGYNIEEPLYRYRESINDYERRSISAAFDSAKLHWRWCRILGYPVYRYYECFCPIISALIPKRLMRCLHYIKDNFT